MKRTIVLLQLFTLAALLVGGIFFVAANHSQAAPMLQETDDTTGANTVYLPSIFAADGSPSLRPITPDQYAADSDDVPDLSEAAVHSSTYCSTYIKLNNRGTGDTVMFWENSYGQEILYNVLGGG